MSQNKAHWGQWADKPAPIKQELLTKIIDVDVAIVGAGFAGVTCALRAAQTGAEVIVLEKSSNWSGRGGNIGVINSSYLKERGYENDPEAVAREWIKLCGITKSWRMGRMKISAKERNSLSRWTNRHITE